MQNPFNPRFPSPMPHDFSRVPRIGSQRSVFKAVADHLLMFDAGKLIPLPPIEVIPGDTIRLDASMLCRLNTPIVPFMSNLNLHSAYFFVPCRQLWSNWEKFMGAKVNPGDSTTYTIPVITGPGAGFAVESIYDYMGIPIDKTKNVNALPFRAYTAIYNHFFRDQNIINSASTGVGDGPDGDTWHAIRRVSKYHDYFTSCLPTPQEGVAASFSLTGTAPVLGIGKVNSNFGGAVSNVYESDATQSNYAAAAYIDGTSGDNAFVIEQSGTAGYPNVRANLETVGALTIAEFRETIQLQALAEMENRSGTRYVEILYGIFNVVSPDFRINIPEYLGGSKTPIYVMPVAQTSSTSGAEPQGQLAAYASGFKGNDGFYKSFVEHGYIIPLIWVRSEADNTYSQGLDRMWTRQTKYDFFNPFLQNIGDQAVLRQEIYLADADAASDATVFGYQERYAEYMYLRSHILGKLRPAYSAPYDYWHLSPELASAPTLSQTFIESDPPISRIVAITSEPAFTMNVRFDCTMTRPMSLHSIPGMLTRM